MQQALLVLRENGRAHEAAVAARVAEQAQVVRRAASVDHLCEGFDGRVSASLASAGAAVAALMASCGVMAETVRRSETETDAVASAAREASAGVGMVAVAAEQLTSSIGEISRQMVYSGAMAREAIGKADATDQAIAGLTVCPATRGVWTRAADC